MRDDQDFWVCLCDIQKSIGGILNALQQHYRVLDNIISRKDDNAAAIAANGKSIAENKVIILELQKNIQQLILQNDLAEKLVAKGSKENKKLAEDLKKHKFNWKDFWKSVQAFMTDIKFIISAVTLLIGLILLWTHVIDLPTLWKQITAIFVN